MLLTYVAPDRPASLDTSVGVRFPPDTQGMSPPAGVETIRQSRAPDRKASARRLMAGRGQERAAGVAYLTSPRRFILNRRAAHVKARIPRETHMRASPKKDLDRRI
jgi:hypothetical protein